MDSYIKDNVIIEINDEEKKSQLIQSILKTRNDLEKAHINFEFADYIDNTFVFISILC